MTTRDNDPRDNYNTDAHVPLVRLRLFALFVFGMFCLLIGRIWFLQVLHGDWFRIQAENNRERWFRTVAPRGVIEDFAGKPLVNNTGQFTVFLTPNDLPKSKTERSAMIDHLAGLLSLPPEQVTDLKAQAAPGMPDPIAVAENLSMHLVARLAENRMRLPGVVTEVEPVRQYPNGTLAAHLLGYIGPINAAQMKDPQNLALGYRSGDFIGASGIEAQYDKYLSGKEGGVSYEIDAKGRRIKELRTGRPVTGATLRLSIETSVQKAAEAALGGRKGAAVALDPRDGRVLALASAPTFDPNLFARRPLATRVYRKMVNPGEGRLIDRAISPEAPGSTFKIVTAAAGLEKGVITPYSGDFCPGFIMFGRHPKRCHSTHGSVNLSLALEASCDVYFYHAGMAMGPDYLADWSKHFGLGAPTGVDLPDEKRGRVPTPAWKRAWVARFGGDPGWYPGDTANVSIGQGDLTATPLQMALVAAGIANRGVIYKPQIVYSATDISKKVMFQMKPEVLQKLPLSPAHIDAIASGMRQVVSGSRGTSHAARVPGINIAGKSGSAEKNGGTHAWFVCYAPAEKPTIAICVFLDGAGGKHLHGGADAAPIARQMMAAHFKVKVSGPLTGGRTAD